MTIIVVVGIMIAVLGIVMMIRKETVKQLLSKEYFIFMIWRILSLLSMIAALHFLMIEQINYIPSGISFVISFYCIHKYNAIKPIPLLANCLQNASAFVSIYSTLTMTIALAAFVFGLISGFDKLLISVEIFSILCFGLFGSGIWIYIRECKKYGIFKEK